MRMTIRIYLLAATFSLMGAPAMAQAFLPLSPPSSPSSAAARPPPNETQGNSLPGQPSETPLAALIQRRTSPSGLSGGSRISFSPDSDGYGAALAGSLFGPGRLSDWDGQGHPAKVEIAPLTIDQSGNSAYAVRVTGEAACDGNGCPTFIFRSDGKNWSPIFQAKTNAVALAGTDSSGYATIVTDGGDRWTYNGSRFDTGR
jgi:hypothetical protein